jgi:hypothetical protein
LDPKPTLIELDQERSSASILGGILALGLLAYFLYYVGALGWLIRAFSRAVRWTIHHGFLAWEVCLSWASWWVLLLMAVGVLVLGVGTAGFVPGWSAHRGEVWRRAGLEATARRGARLPRMPALW